jgi:hypothetical protein
MLGNVPGVEMKDLNAWCRAHLKAGIDDVLFCERHLSTVVGVELTTAQRVVVKLRPPAPRLTGCATVHRHFFERGFPCAEPLVDLAPIGDSMASAEVMVSDGDLFPLSLRAPAPFAEALAWLVSLAPEPGDVSSLDPPPPWTRPGFARSELWPAPDDSMVGLNAAEGPSWIDGAAELAREKLRSSASALAIGHGDWHTANLRWRNNTLLAVWDWDSAIAASEPVIAGLAAAVYPVTESGTEATVAESEAFLNAYQAARGFVFGNDELTQAWAAGLWVRAFDAKKRCASDGVVLLKRDEALERGRRVLGP